MPSDSFSQRLGRPRQYRVRFGSLRAIVALMLREMATTYGRSPGGYIWAIIEPVAGILMLSLVFSAIFDTPAIGISFPMFYATGILPFTLFTSVQNKVSGALTYSRPLLAYPTVTFIDALLARFVLETITRLLVAYIVLTGCMVLLETRVNPDLPTIVEAFGLVMLLGLGIGTLNCFLFTQFSILQRVWAIITMPLFIISGIFFTYEMVPKPYQDYLWYNPLVHVVGLMRRGFYKTYDAEYVNEAYVLGIALTCLAFGLVLLRRHHRDLLNNR